ncbi:KAP family P-loop NTPase fold protein [Vibrio fluvialis]|nr:hypothetical protein [Vibrio fluvialis]
MANIHGVPPSITFDIFPVIDRRSYSEHLTNFLNSKAESGYVLNLNAEWGAGKTTFLQCWYNELKKDHPVVYFDAWKSDFTHDAMLAITECFHSQLMSPLVEDKDRLTQLKDKGTHLLKVALPSLLVGYLKHKTGKDEDDSLLGDISTELNIEISKDDLGDALKETMKAMINQKKKVEGIHVFRESLENLANSYLEAYNDVKPPIYVLVDELDRCRPTYAIETIECIKHFFNTKNFVFVLATDTEQLQHSIKSVYGQSFDSSSYLSRFFNNTATLESPNIYNFIKTKLPELSNLTPTDELALSFIQELFQWHNIDSLRDIDKIFDCIDIARSKNKCFKIFPLILLSILKTKFPEFYSKYLSIGGTIYNTSSTSSRRMNEERPLVPGKIYSQFSVINQSKVFTDHLFQLVLNNIDKELEYGDLLKLNSIPAHSNISTIFPQFMSIALINSELELSKKQDYLSVLNFAGHFQ